MNEQCHAAGGVHPGHFKVTVNTEENIVNKSVLTFQEVCELAFPDDPFGERIVYSMLRA